MNDNLDLTAKSISTYQTITSVEDDILTQFSIQSTLDISLSLLTYTNNTNAHF